MHLQEENGGAGVYSADLRKHYMLDNPSWKRDIMPEIIEGKNIMDYVDPEIEAKLEALEMEEEALAAAAAIEVCACVMTFICTTSQPLGCQCTAIPILQARSI